MERLTGLDAFFLYVETPTQPLNVCCVLELDASTMPGGYTYGRLRAALAKHLKALPEFRMKLADTQLNLDHPVWVDDENFQLELRRSPRVGRDMWVYRRATAGPRPAAVGDVGA
jgi:diacylglycerol O-acyltransferase